MLQEEHGLLGDAHAGSGHRQVSLLAYETLQQAQASCHELACGGFGENITTRGIDLTGLPVGTKLNVGPALLEVTQIGKDCTTPCAISQKMGSCLLPSQGIFARVITGGSITVGDTIEAVTIDAPTAHHR